MEVPRTPRIRSLGTPHVPGAAVSPRRELAGSASSKGGAKHMIKWNYRATRIALVLGAIAAFAVASGASTKWG